MKEQPCENLGKSVPDGGNSRCKGPGAGSAGYLGVALRPVFGWPGGAGEGEIGFQGFTEERLFLPSGDSLTSGDRSGAWPAVSPQ